MKIFCVDYSKQGEHAVITTGDDILLRNNNDFYIPDFCTKLSCVPQFVLKICKLGKCFSNRFANRYFDEFTVGLRFYADNIEDVLVEKALPTTSASTFDSCAPIGPLCSWHNGAVMEFWVNDKMVYSQTMSTDLFSLLSEASDKHTFKIGDFFYCGSTYRHTPIVAGDTLRLTLDGNDVLTCKIV